MHWIRKSRDAFKKELELLKNNVKGKIKGSEAFVGPQLIGQDYPSFIGEFDGRKLYITIDTSRIDIPLLEYYIFAKTVFELSLVKEGFASEVGKGLGFEHEITLGIPKFDDEFLIHGNPEEKVKEFLINKSHTIEALENFKQFEIRENYLAVKYTLDSDYLFKSSKMLEVIKALSILAQAMKILS